MLQQVQRTGNGIFAREIAGTEERAGVSPNGEVAVGRTTVDQAEDRHESAPADLAIEHFLVAAFVAGRFIQEFIEGADPVGLGIGGIVDGEEFP